MKPITITIALVAHNESKTIGALLRSITLQKLPNHVKHVDTVLISDGSTDRTVDVAKSLHVKGLTILNRKTQEGKNSRLNELFMRTNSDITILLDADIRFEGNLVIAKLLTPFTRSRRIGFVSGNPVPLAPQTLAGRASVNWIRTLVALRKTLRNGDNPYSACGPIMALSKPFYKTIRLPLNVPDDRYMYFEAKNTGFEFRYAEKARVRYRSAESNGELYRQGIRYWQLYQNLRMHFGKEIVDDAFRLPSRIRISMLVSQLVNDPAAFLYMKYLHLRILTKNHNERVDRWQPLPTSKYISTV